MADELDYFYDLTGEIRRCGSLVPTGGPPEAVKVFEQAIPVWDDADIIRAAKDPNRKLGRRLFGPGWVQNQRTKGSCNGYALAGSLSKARFLRGITDGLLLSGSYPYSKMNGGVDGGSELRHGLQVIEKYGCPPEAMCPWDRIFPGQQPRNIDEVAAKHKGIDCYAVETRQGFRTALAMGFQVIVAVSAGRGFQTLDRNGVAGVDRGSGNHAVHCDDLVILPNGDEVYDHQNSWGLGYGTQGRSYLRWDSFAATFGVHTFYAVPSTTEEGWQGN